MAWACRKAKYDARLVPIPRFTSDLAESDEKLEIALPLTASSVKLINRIIGVIGLFSPMRQISLNPLLTPFCQSQWGSTIVFRPFS
jgi:hypothetical protein